ncbi:hypothetical protein EAO69_30605 [Streptomyces sp. me109]|uniref:hypothetical protein n=1 Tax=Streptomyces sp. me109 TaxID=1827853 RepID=UPI0011CD4437|nr:hypothetical protein [Streptomyces sp. me109]TXS65953.1 hypothetical protein EAO69_30605 [Streptomyces sp. me109]
MTGRTGSLGLPRLLTAALPPPALCVAVGVTDGVGRRPAPLVRLLVLALAWFSAGALRDTDPAPGDDR